MRDTWERIYDAVCQIPKGKVASYGQIAALAGNPRMARAVGNALHTNPRPGEIPCHRVVNREGRLAPSFAFGGQQVQRLLLLEEGVLFRGDGTVDMEACRWTPEK